MEVFASIQAIAAISQHVLAKKVEAQKQGNQITNSSAEV